MSREKEKIRAGQVPKKKKKNTLSIPSAHTREGARERAAVAFPRGRAQPLDGLPAWAQRAVRGWDRPSLAAPAARMRKLLTAKDKRATLLEMAGANEVDKELIALLDQNAKAAKDAGQEEAAEFLGKVRDAARKFLISV